MTTEILDMFPEEVQNCDLDFEKMESLHRELRRLKKKLRRGKHKKKTKKRIIKIEKKIKKNEKRFKKLQREFVYCVSCQRDPYWQRVLELAVPKAFDLAIALAQQKSNYKEAYCLPDKSVH